MNQYYVFIYNYCVVSYEVWQTVKNYYRYAITVNYI